LRVHDGELRTNSGGLIVATDSRRLCANQIRIILRKISKQAKL
jgi:hypothetical protein